MDKKDWLGIGITIFLGWICLHGGLIGCAGPRYTADNKQYAMRGPCFTWGSVEKQRMKNHGWVCGTKHPTIPSTYCNRQDGHSFSHHMHRGENCLAVWK